MYTYVRGEWTEKGGKRDKKYMTSATICTRGVITIMHNIPAAALRSSAFFPEDNILTDTFDGGARFKHGQLINMEKRTGEPMR